MPELPEVHTTVIGIAPIVNKKIARLWSDWDKALFLAEENKLAGKDIVLKPADARAYNRLLANREIIGVARRGKYILIRTSGDYALLIHQKMTGHLLLGKWRLTKRGALPISSPRHPLIAEKVNRYVHFVLEFRDGAMLGLSDVRKFGRVILGKERAVLRLPQLISLGPDPLDKNLTPRKFAERLAKKSPIKKILLDQAAIAGIGNIYSDEILFRAKIHPLRAASDAARESAKILKIARAVLRKSIRLGGASKTNYRNPAGAKGASMKMCLVYGRAGKPCIVCKTIVRKLPVGGRTASFCPGCQKT